MQHRLATILTTAFVTLALSACGAQQPTANAPDPQSVESADPQTSGVTSAPPTTSDSAPATTASLPEPPRVPSTGLPSAEFCAAGEAYLAKFPDLPLVERTSKTEYVSSSITCEYNAAVGNFDAPRVGVGAINLAGDSADLSTYKQMCTTGPDSGFTKIEAGWIKSRGWSGWMLAKEPAIKTVLCTDANYLLTSTVVNVPGATPEDAFNVMFAAMD